MKASIYINKVSNPLASELKHIIQQEGHRVVSTLEESDILISLAYSHSGDIMQMTGMKAILLDAMHENKKIIFLSWFDFPNQLYHYYNFINPENKECVVMDASKYRIIQLPASIETIFESVNSLLITCNE